MTISKGKWRTGADTVSTMCRNWVNPDVTGRDEMSMQARLIGLLFSVPLLSVLHLGANLNGKMTGNLIVPMLALAFALPVTAAAALSISGSVKTRNLVTALFAPVAFLLVSGGRIGLAPVFYLALAVCAFEAIRARQVRGAWAVSAALLCLTSLVIGVSVPFSQALEAGFAGLAPIALAAAGYAMTAPKKSKEVKMPAISPSFALADTLVAPTGALIVESARSGFVQAVGQNALSLLGLDSAELSGKGLAARIHIADKVAYLSWLDAVPDQPQPGPLALRVKSGRFDGKGVPEWAQLKAFARAAGDAILLTFVNETAAHAPSDAPAALDSGALAVVSHELRTPLNAIVGFSDMLKQEMFGPLENDRQREYIGLVHQSGLHLLGVVNAMLDWSRIENGSMELKGAAFAPMEAAAFAVGVVSSSAMKKKIGLNFVPNAGFDEFNGDQRACQQILINLLSNAVKFTPDGGMVNLMVDVDGDRLLMVVEDTGIGMTRDQTGRVGTPFYQVDGGHARSHEGTGLGLALVKQMAKLHGGSVEIDSEPGRGTKVTVALASVHAKGANVTPIHQAAGDESVRIIRVFEERGHGTQRKTA